MAAVDLNCDLGESFGAYRIGMDEEVIPWITSANIACGFHGGDPLVMEKTVKQCKKHQVSAGAHPGFPDLLGFGRRNMTVSPEEVKAYVKYQIGALKAFCDSAGIQLHHVKPHGALYNMAGKDDVLAAAICQAIQEIDRNLPILALSGSQMIEAAKEVGIPYVSEVFADRAYAADGSLLSRNLPGSMIEEEELAITRVIQMVKEGTVNAVDGTVISIQADSICVHGDSLKALAFVQRIRMALEKEQILVHSF